MQAIKQYSNQLFLSMLFMLTVFVAGCGSSGGDTILGTTVSETGVVPAVVAVAPLNGATNVAYNLRSVTAEFSVPMNGTTLTAASFTLSKGSPAVLETGGVVTYANGVAVLALDANLTINTLYTATITTVAKSADGVALASNYVWTFTTGATADTTRPTVISTSPINGAIGVSITKIITATFSEPMISSSITATAPATFRLMETNTSTNIPGTATYSVINKIASFNPTLDLAQDTNYTATITTVAKDLAGNTMLLDHNWTFKTAAAPAEFVALGLASTYGIAATAGVTNTATAPNTLIDGNTVLNPTASCNGVPITFADNPGFGACGGFAPSINGNVITPTNPDAITAQPVTDDLRAAYLSITPANMPGGTAIAAGTTLGAPIGNPLVVGDNLFYTGVYKSITSILITGDLTLDAQGNPDATFVFQSASTVGTAPNARILLVGGAKASNVWWQAGSDATLQTNTTWNGNILAYRDITMVTGSSSCGRLFAGAFTDGAFVFDSNHVSVPGHINAPATCD